MKTEYKQLYLTLDVMIYASKLNSKVSVKVLNKAFEFLYDINSSILFDDGVSENDRLYDNARLSCLMSVGLLGIVCDREKALADAKLRFSKIEKP